MKSLIKKKKISIIGAFSGGVLGYLYYYFIGCSTGSCAITSHPLNSIIYGIVMGYLVMSVFEKNKKQDSRNRSIINKNQLK